MAKKALLDADIKLGEKILASLDAAKYPVSAAVWTLTEDYGGWQLVIGTPLYSKGIAEAHVSSSRLCARTTPNPSTRRKSV
jgi:hypothetical protein